MASRGKARTTAAKLNRESKLRERRLDKQARKEARRQAASAPPPPDDLEAKSPPDSDE
jgi:hypothetical protein